MQRIEMVELRSLCCIKLRVNDSPPASRHTVPPRGSQEGGTGLLKGSKAAGQRQSRGRGRDRQGDHHPAWWQGSEGRAGFLTSRQHLIRARGARKNSVHQHWYHDIDGQRSLEERVFRSTMKGQKVNLSKGHPRPTVLIS